MVKQDSPTIMRKRFCLLVLAALSLGGCKTLTLVPEDLPETVPMTARCTAGKAGNFTLVLTDGDGSLSPPGGQAIPAPVAPFRAQSQFTPNQTGRSRGGRISCYHSVDNPGRAVRKRFKVRERVAPTIVQFQAPNTARVGQAFNVTVDIKDDPTAAGLGDASGLDEIHVNTTGPLRGPGVIDLAGTPPGPPDGAQGPRRYSTPISLTCTREGDATIRLFVLDAARNQIFSRIHSMGCTR